MSIAELVPTWKGLPDPTGPVLEGHSMRGRQYRLRASEAELVLGDIAKARGIDDIAAFTRPSMRDLPDPCVLEDMDIAAVRFADALANRERILVFGDYDVDGACSTSVLVRFCRLMGHDADHFIPDRIAHGYGPGPKALADAKADDYDLVIFVDCGTAASGAIEEMSADVLIVDHHKPQGDLPRALACVNPHRDDDTSGLGMLCAAGLAFMLCIAARRTLRTNGAFALSEEPDLRGLLDLVALATVADVVPLVGASRLLVAAGLAILERAPSPGVKALMDVAGVSDVTAGRLGFALGPRINAAGRIGRGSGFEGGARGVALLLSEDSNEAAFLASELNGLNAERQQIEKEALEQALQVAEKQVDEGAGIICVWSRDWHPGVVGIVAGRVRERFDRPAIVGSSDGETIKASGRSVPGFDLGELVIEARAQGLLSSGGGHAAACGLGCPEGSWDDLSAFLQEHASWDAKPVTIDCRAGARRLNVPQTEALDLLQPFGQGNPSVSCILEGFEVCEVKPFGQGHIRLVSSRKDLEVLFWRAESEGLAYELSQLRGQVVSVVGVPKINEWNGRKKVAFEASDILLS